MKDPDAKRNELYKRDEDRLKATMRRASKQKRVKERAGNKELSKDYLEADADDEGTSISAIKNQHKQQLKGGYCYCLYRLLILFITPKNGFM